MYLDNYGFWFQLTAINIPDYSLYRKKGSSLEDLGLKFLPRDMGYLTLDVSYNSNPVYDISFDFEKANSCFKVTVSQPFILGRDNMLNITEWTGFCENNEISAIIINEFESLKESIGKSKNEEDI